MRSAVGLESKGRFNLLNILSVKSGDIMIPIVPNTLAKLYAFLF